MPGIDIARSRSGDASRGREAFQIPVDAQVVSMFARVGPMKGQADFVRCLGQLVAVNQDLYGVMCGPADIQSRYWRTLEGLVDDLGLSERLIIPGDVRSPLKEDLVAASDVVVHPSHAESFGLAVLEAMAAGKAVVAAATDGPRLLIEDGVSGVLVEPGNIQELTAAVARLLGDGGVRASLGVNAARAAEAHQVDDMVRAFECTWEDVLAMHRRA
jgi:glycosyltransferase involved in cell wall biosynthesis